MHKNNNKSEIKSQLISNTYIFKENIKLISTSIIDQIWKEKIRDSNIDYFFNRSNLTKTKIKIPSTKNIIAKDLPDIKEVDGEIFSSGYLSSDYSGKEKIKLLVNKFEENNNEEFIKTPIFPDNDRSISPEKDLNEVNDLNIDPKSFLLSENTSPINQNNKKITEEVNNYDSFDSPKSKNYIDKKELTNFNRNNN